MTMPMKEKTSKMYGHRMEDISEKKNRSGIRKRKRFLEKNAVKRGFALALAFCLFWGITGCGQSTDSAGNQVSDTSSGNQIEETSQSEKKVGDSANSAADHSTDISSSLVYDHSMELIFARGFSVDYYNDGYKLITVDRDGQYLIVPEGFEAPEDLEEDIVPLYEPLDYVYLAASAVMDMYVALGALDDLRFSALEADDWYIEEARQQMEEGRLVYAGKYSAPDYELIVSEGCSLAIENTMIYHNPEVKEQLEKFHIPVLVDYSSYESDPMGRVEWVKLYGVLTGKEEEAVTAFDAQKSLFQEAVSEEKTDLTVAFFYITSNGAVNVRKTTDYLPKMIELAGGNYIFDDLGSGDDNASSTVSMQMEKFYAAAKDADYIIYNSTIEGELNSMDDLLAVSPLLEKFKAVQENHVYCTTNNLYQASMELGTITADIHKMLTGDDGNLTYLYRVE